MDIKPIETSYKGVLFRSRLEARWAVFFDALGIDWMYEPEAFYLPDGQKYLPDFWLPKFDYYGMYAEIKHTEFSDIEFAKCRDLCDCAGYRVWLCPGPPMVRAYKVLHPKGCWRGDDLSKDFDIGIPCADQAEGENRMYSYPGYENDDLSISKEYRDCVGENYLNAVNRANSMRFWNPAA